MHCPTLRAIGATAALALAASATTACSQDKAARAARAEQALAAQAKEDGLTIEQERWLRSVIGPQDKLKKPPPYSEALVPAKLGPNTFNFPMNLYEHQRGPDFQGSVSLLLKWPSLEPYAPGFVAKKGANDAISDTGIRIGLDYLSRASAEQVFQDSIKPHSYDDPADPRTRLDARQRGSSVYGLDVYYIDTDRLTSFLQQRGAYFNNARMLELGEDWYLLRAPNGTLETKIVCTTSKIPGATLIRGKLENTPPGVARGLCKHTFILRDANLMVEISYLRAYLPDWERIEKAVRKRLATATSPLSSP